jgi:hypothetical protein
LEATEAVVGKYVVCSSDSVKKELLLEIGRLDILVRQKSDQIHFLFVSQPHEAPAHKISHPQARALWIQSFGLQVRMVPWSEFIPDFLEASGEEGAFSEAEIVCLNQFLDFTLDGWVSTYEVEIFLKSFGPLTGCGHRVLGPYKSGILAGYTSSVEANALLRGREPGSYLVRFSKSNPGAFAVTFVDSKHRTKHCLLYCAKPSGITLKEPPDIFPALPEFIRAHSGRLKYGLGLEAQRLRPVDVTVVTSHNNRYSNSDNLVGDVGSDKGYAADGCELIDDLPGEKMCVICMAAPVTTCFIPCGHVVCCNKCGKKLEAMKERRCPVCRGDVTKLQPIFLV